MGWISTRTVRVSLIALMALAAATGAAGITEHVAFHQPSDLKYAVTIAGPLLLLLAASVEEPLNILGPAVIVVAPFGAFVVTVSGIHISALAVLLVLSAAAAIISGVPSARLSRAGVAAAIAVPLLAVPLILGSDGRGTATVLLVIIVTAWVVSRAARGKHGLALVLWAVLASAALQAAIAIWEYQSGHLLNLYGSAGSTVFGVDYFFGYGSKNRPIGSFFDPISLGNMLALACPIALALAATSRTPRARVLAAAAGVLVGVALALSLSRASWIGAAAGILVTIVFLPPKVRWVAFVPAVAATAAVAVLATSGSGGTLGTRFQSIFHPTGVGVRTAQGDRQRTEYWTTALRTAAEHPIFGVGFGSLLVRLQNADPAASNTALNAQSTYLQVLAEAGIAGAGALLIVLVGLARDLVAGLRSRRALMAGVAGASTALLIGWVTDYTIRYVQVAASVAVLFGVIASQTARRSAP